MYRVLIVIGARDAAGGILDVEGEVTRLANIGGRYDGMSITICPGTNELEIADFLTLSDHEYDAVHLMGHADDNGFYLETSTPLTDKKIQRICLDAGARLVFINSCISARIGQYLVNNKMAVAICYSSPVIDSDAIAAAMRFYAALAKSNDPFEDGLREAYDSADPGDGSLMWLTNGMYVAQIIRPIMDRLTLMDGENGALPNLQGEVSTLGESVTCLSKSNTHTRYTLFSVLAIIIILVMGTVWIASTSAQTIPPRPTNNGTIPPAASPAKPTKKPKPTKTPTAEKTKPGGNIPPTPHTPSAPLQTTQRPNPTKEPDKTRKPSPADTRRPTANPAATDIPTKPPTRKPRPTPTLTLAPPLGSPSATFTKPPLTTTPTMQSTAPATIAPTAIIIPSSTPTMTEFEKAVHNAVMATVESWCTCE